MRRLQLTERVPDITAPSARYPFEVTLHQGAIEAILSEPMENAGVCVERPVVPTLIELSQDPRNIEDPQAYAVKVRAYTSPHPLNYSTDLEPLVRLFSDALILKAMRTVWKPSTPGL